MPLSVRVVDAQLHEAGGPVELVVTELRRSREVADAVLHAGASARLDGERLLVVAKPSQLVDAAGRTGGADLAEPLRAVVDSALASWGGSVPDVVTPAGILPTSTRAVVMGILNVTPDSFSDGGDLADVETAVAHGLDMIAAGADVLDVGGESTRPGAEPVDAATEIERVVPVVEQLAAAGHVVSVDTTKAAVAEAAVAAGAALVNDVSAGRFDPDLLPAVAALGVPYVLMHAVGDSLEELHTGTPTYEDVVADVVEFLAAQTDRLAAAGITSDRVIVDPGIGFGKSLEDNLALLQRTRELTSLGRVVLVGSSRKSWLGGVTGVTEPAERVIGSAVAAAFAVGGGARMVRVHDIAATVEAVAVAQALHAAG